MFDHGGLIIGGDLNLTLVDSEIWGAGKINDQLYGFFNSYFQQAGLVDIKLLVLSPTWSNSRLGKEGIAKRLDYFFMAETLSRDILEGLPFQVQ